MFDFVCVCCKNWPFNWMIFMQVASNEWFLGVQIQHFENLYNAKIVFDRTYCCCGFHLCSKNITDLQGMCTADVCQPYILIHIRDSSCTGTCSLDKTYHLSNESSGSILNHAVLSIPIKEMEGSDHVRIKIS